MNQNFTVLDMLKSLRQAYDYWQDQPVLLRPSSAYEPSEFQNHRWFFQAESIPLITFLHLAT